MTYNNRTIIIQTQTVIVPYALGPLDKLKQTGKSKRLKSTYWDNTFFLTIIDTKTFVSEHFSKILSK